MAAQEQVMPREVNPDALNALLGRAVQDMGAALQAPLILIGDKLGLYRAMGDGTPVTPKELAKKTKTAERYVREWLNANAAGQLVEFDGAGQTYCELLDGPCVDLNLMVAASTPVKARVARLDAGIAVAAAQDQATVVFGVDDPLLLESDAGENTTLEPWDLAVIRGSGARLNRVASGNIPTVGSVFIATLDE